MADKQYVVSGPVAVLGTHDGSERYLYRGAVFPRSSFKAESVDRVVDAGLLTELPNAEELAQQAEADRVAREAAEKAAFDARVEAAATKLVADREAAAKVTGQSGQQPPAKKQ